MTELTASDFQDQLTEELFEVSPSNIEDVELNPRPSIIPEIVGTTLTIAIPTVMGVVESYLVGTTQFGIHFPINYTSNDIYQAVLTATLIYLPYRIHKATHAVYNWNIENKSWLMDIVSSNPLLKNIDKSLPYGLRKITHKIYNSIKEDETPTRIGLTDVISSVPLSLATQNTAAWAAVKSMKGFRMMYMGRVDKKYIMKAPPGKVLFSDSGLGLSWAHIIAYGISLVTLSLSLANRLKPIKGFGKLEKFESKVYNFMSDFSSKSPLHNFFMNTILWGATGVSLSILTGNKWYNLALGYGIVDLGARGDKIRDYLFKKYGERITRAVNSFADKVSSINF